MRKVWLMPYERTHVYWNIEKVILLPYERNNVQRPVEEARLSLYQTIMCRERGRKRMLPREKLRNNVLRIRSSVRAHSENFFVSCMSHTVRNFSSLLILRVWRRRIRDTEKTTILRQTAIKREAKMSLKVHESKLYLFSWKSVRLVPALSESFLFISNVLFMTNVVVFFFFISRIWQISNTTRRIFFANHFKI